MIVVFLVQTHLPFSPARGKIHDVSQRALLYYFIEHELQIWSETKPARFNFGSILKTCSASSSNAYGIGLNLSGIAFPSTIWAAPEGLSDTGLMSDSRLCRSFDLSVVVNMSSVVDRDQDTCPRRNYNVNWRPRSCSREKSTNRPKIFLLAFSYVILFCELVNVFVTPLVADVFD